MFFLPTRLFEEKVVSSFISLRPRSSLRFDTHLINKLWMNESLPIVGAWYWVAASLLNCILLTENREVYFHGKYLSELQ